jgi:hypothetical protein
MYSICALPGNEVAMVEHTITTAYNFAETFTGKNNRVNEN